MDEDNHGKTLFPLPLLGPCAGMDGWMDGCESGDTEVSQNQDVVGCFFGFFLHIYLEKQSESVVMIFKPDNKGAFLRNTGRLGC